MDQVAIQIPRLSYKEGSAFVATAFFRDRATQAASAPTTIKYRIDCLTTGIELVDWTTVSAAANVSISVTSTHNAIQDECNKWERKQLTVAGDPDAAGQVRETAEWTVTNLHNVP